MTFGKITLAAAALAMSGSAAFAGGLSPAVLDTSPPPPPMMEPASSSAMGSLGSATPFIIGALVIGGIAAIASSSDSDSAAGTLPSE